MFAAKVIEDSVSYSEMGTRLVTMQLQYPRFIHAEFMTHRVFSRNASSSRAIPVSKMVEQVRKQPAMPIHWGKNQPGMQAREELSDSDKGKAFYAWMAAASRAADWAETLMDIGAHKQIANRILEPFQWMHVVVSATEWYNFFSLRRHLDAQPEIQHLANLMFDAMQKSTPRVVTPDLFQMDKAEHWHLPYISAQERATIPVEILKKASVARCARVSYLNHDGTNPDIKKDLELFERLVGSEPMHASPTEHQATPIFGAPKDMTKNFRGWVQYRAFLEDQAKTQVEAA